MNRVITNVTLLLMTGTLMVHGQVINSYGLKAGISLANQSHKLTPIDYTIETELIIGPAVSLFLEAFAGKHFSAQLDLGYAVKGSETTTQSVTVNHLDNDRVIINTGEPAVSKFSYISLSPMARYRFDLESLVPYLLLGPRIDFQVHYQTDSEYPLDEQNIFILGLTFGAGLEFRLKKVTIFTELQFQPDLSPVTNKNPLLINNDIVSVTLGIRRIASP